MSNWVGGLPPEPKPKVDEKKANKGGKPGSPPDHGGHPKTFFGGAIPPVPPKLPKYSKEDLKPPKVTFVGGPPAFQPAPTSPKAPSPKAPPPTPPATPPAPSPPPPPPPSPASEPMPQSYSPPPLPKRFPSVYDKKPKKKKKKKRKKPPPPPPRAPVECDDCEEHSEGEGKPGKLASIFAICHVPATRQGFEDDDGVYEKEDRSGHASPRSGDEDEGPDIPPEVPSYMRGNAFAGIFGKKIDARNLAEVGPHGWHDSAKAPYDITDTGDTVTVGASGWHEPRSE